MVITQTHKEKISLNSSLDDEGLIVLSDEEDYSEMDRLSFTSPSTSRRLKDSSSSSGSSTPESSRSPKSGYSLEDSIQIDSDSVIEEIEDDQEESLIIEESESVVEAEFIEDSPVEEEVNPDIDPFFHFLGP
jgi:hypothetical protein